MATPSTPARAPVQSGEGARRLIADLVREHPRTVVVSLVAGAGAALAQGYGIALLTPLLSLVGVGEPSQAEALLNRITVGVLEALHIPVRLETILVLFVAIVAAEQLLRMFQISYARRFLGNFILDLRVRLHRAYLRMTWEAWAQRQAGDLASKLTLEGKRAETAIMHLTGLASDFILMVVLLITGLVLSWAASLVLIGAGALILVAFRGTSRSVGRAGADLSAQNSAFQAGVIEHLQAAKLIKATSSEEWSARRIAALSRTVNDVEVNANVRLYRSSAVLPILIVAVISAGFYLSVTFLEVDVARALVILVVFYRLGTRLAGSFRLFQEFVLAAPAYEEMHRSLADAEAHAEQPDAALLATPAVIRSGIALDGVRFSYSGQQPALHDISVSIPVNTTVGIVGESGSGKTTILDLLMGLLTPQRGAVLVDGAPLQSLDLRLWRTDVGYVGHNQPLFVGTVRDNIVLGASDLSQADVEQAARLAHAHAFIMALPQGYDTPVGDRGGRFSAGEQQRIALARALVRRPGLLILDEATSALDAASERAVLEAVDGLRSQMTIVIVAHRLSAVRNADRIYVVEKGWVLEEGSWQALTAKGGRFQELWALQSQAAASG